MQVPAITDTCQHSPKRENKTSTRGAGIAFILFLAVSLNFTSCQKDGDNKGRALPDMPAHAIERDRTLLKPYKGRGEIADMEIIQPKQIIPAADVAPDELDPLVDNISSTNRVLTKTDDAFPKIQYVFDAGSTSLFHGMKIISDCSDSYARPKKMRLTLTHKIKKLRHGKGGGVHVPGEDIYLRPIIRKLNVYLEDTAEKQVVLFRNTGRYPDSAPVPRDVPKIDIQVLETYGKDASKPVCISGMDFFIRTSQIPTPVPKKQETATPKTTP